MQLYLKFHFDSNLTLPVSYNHIVQDLIYNKLKSDSNHSAFLHDQGFEADENKVFNRIVLTELASPKPSYLPFYIRDNNKAALPGYDAKSIKINGRKYYWHSKAIQKAYAKTKRNATMEYVGAGAVFEFKIYYDGITEEELSKLIFALDFWEHDENGNLCHKFGHGKPIGFGSVKISVVDKLCYFRSFDGEKHCVEGKTLTEYTNPYHDTGDTIIKELLAMVDFSKAPTNVRYPGIVANDSVRKKIESRNNTRRKKDSNDLASHKWFSKNSEDLRHGKGQILPLPPDPSVHKMNLYRAETEDTIR